MLKRARARRQVPYTACKLVAFEFIFDSASRAASNLALTTEPRAVTPGKGPLPPRLPRGLRTAVVLGSGVSAGALAAVVSQPFDLLLTRLCGSTALVTECIITDTIGSQLQYLISLGPEAFSGLGPRLAMVSLMTSCQFLLYDRLRPPLRVEEVKAA